MRPLQDMYRSWRTDAALGSLRRRYDSALQYCLATIAVGLAFLFTLWLRPLVDAHSFLLFFVAVVVIAWYGSPGPSLFAAFLSALVVNGFLLHSFPTLVPSGADLPQLGIFMIVSLAISLLCARRQLAEGEVARVHEELESKVFERTAELAIANLAMRDEIAERKRSEDALRESESVLRSFFDSSDMMRGIVELAGDDIIHISDNAASAAFFGMTREGLRNKRMSEMDAPAESLQIWPARCRDSQLASAPVSFDYVYETAKGQRFLSATTTFVGMGSTGRPRFAYVILDMTERKRLEAQFMQAQKMEALGVLAGGVAHDFNNLLTVILGYADFLLSELPDTDPRRADFEQIKQAGQRAVSLTSQLLAFSRKQVLQPRLVDLNDVIADTGSILRRLIGEDIDLAALPQPGLGLVRADPGQIQQIIMNLSVNARDAMPRGGKLTIETANVDLEENYIQSHAMVPAGAYVMLAISDNGAGMDAETQARIFEPFFTTKGQGKGTGLGLSTVYGIVKQSGGFIWVYSELDRGATFKIYLPRVQGQADKDAGHVKEEVSLRGTETVLVVEDESAVRTLVCRALRERGYTVIEAPTGKEALQTAQQTTAAIHLVLTDVVMPETSGKALAAQIEAARPGIPVLFISGYPNDAIVHHGILDSNTAFLQKPFTADALARKVRHVLDPMR